MAKVYRLLWTKKNVTILLEARHWHDSGTVVMTVANEAGTEDEKACSSTQDRRGVDGAVGALVNRKYHCSSRQRQRKA
jgi:hypothetical protein